MKQIYYAIQSTLHGRGSNVTKVISLSLGLTIGVLLFSQIAFELNYEKCYPDADRLVLVRGGGENVKTGEKGEGYDDGTPFVDHSAPKYHADLRSVSEVDP